MVKRFKLEDMPRVKLAHLPTPLEFAPSLSEKLESVRLFVKRDDCTGLGLGGNKTRKLEFSIGAALAAGADHLVTTGAWQSNHVRQSAAAAARVGMGFHAILSDPVSRESEIYASSGNLLLNRLFGAELHFAADGEGATVAQVEAVVARIRAQGGMPYVLPLGASNGVGALGYAVCARELLAQCAELEVRPSAIVLATGSGGTHAGLLGGLRLEGSLIPVIGISVSDVAAIQKTKVRTTMDEMLDLLEVRRSAVPDVDIIVHDDYSGAGYAMTDEITNATVRMVAETEGLLLDPVYTGKAMAGLFHLAHRGLLTGDVVFLHTGGAPALFAYADEFTPAIQAKQAYA